MAKNLRDTIVDEGLLECCICTETLTDPRTLPCGHSLCLKCLEDDCRVRSKHGKYPCPYCRKELEVPQQGFAVWGCNIMIKNLVDLLKKFEAVHPCRIIEEHEKAKINLSKRLDQLDDNLRRLNEREKMIKENDDISNKALLEEEQAIKVYYQKLMISLTENDIQSLRKLHAENQAKREELRREIRAKSDALKLLREQVSNVISLGTATETLQLEQPLVNEVQGFGLDTEIRSVPERFSLRYVPTYPKCTPGEVKKVSAMLGGVAQCVLEIDTRMPGEEDVSDITGLTVLPNGDILAVDGDNHKVKRYNSKGESVGEPLVSAGVESPWNSIHSPDGSVMVSCEAGVMTFNADGRTQRQAVNNSALGLALTSDSQLVVTASTDNEIMAPSVQLYSPSGELVWEVGIDEEGENMFNNPCYVTVNSRDDIIVTDEELQAVFILDKHGELVTKYVTTGIVEGVCVDKRDFIYVAIFDRHEIISLTPNGHFHRVVLSEQDIVRPAAIAFDNHDRLLVGCSDDVTETYNIIKAFNITFT